VIIQLALATIPCLIPAILFGAIVFSLRDIESNAVKIVLGLASLVVMSFFVWLIVAFSIMSFQVKF